MVLEIRFNKTIYITIKEKSRDVNRARGPVVAALEENARTPAGARAMHHSGHLE